MACDFRLSVATEKMAEAYANGTREEYLEAREGYFKEFERLAAENEFGVLDYEFPDELYDDDTRRDVERMLEIIDRVSSKAASERWHRMYNDLLADSGDGEEAMENIEEVQG